MESLTFFEMKMGCKMTCVKALLADLLGSHRIYQEAISLDSNNNTSLTNNASITNKNSENVVKSSCFDNVVAMESNIFFIK